MKNKVLQINLLAFTLLLLPLFSLAGQTEFYVAPDGSDSNSGTLAQPFLTLAKAKDAVATAIPSMTGDITVYFKGGDYFFTEAVEFTTADAGLDTNRIIYTAYENDKPVFNGATKVTGWEKYDDNIYQAQLDHTEKLRTLIVNGTRAYMASKTVSGQGSWGTYNVVAGQADWARTSGSSPEGIKYNLSDVPALSNPDDVEFWTGTTWNTHIICASDILEDGGQRILKLQQPAGAIAYNQKWGRYNPSGSHTLYNAFELLDEPGEFYFNRKTSTLYYYPNSGEDMTSAEVYAPKIGEIISIQGNSLTERVSNLTFQGITFAYTESKLPKVGDSEGKSTVQAATWCVAYDEPDWHATAYRAYDVTPSSVRVNSAQNIKFIDNTFKHIGNDAIGFINDVSDSEFVGNICTDLGGAAVLVGHPQHVYIGDVHDYEKYSPEEEGICRNILIENNVLYDMTKMYHGHAPVTAFFVDSLQLVRNHIQKCNYSAVSVGWGWYDFDEVAIPDNPTTTCRNNVLSYNRVYDCMEMLHDGGAFYTLGSQPNSTTDGNYVKAATVNFQGVYHPDEGTAWYTGKDMVFEISRGQDNFELQVWKRRHDIHYSNIYTTSTSMNIGAPNCTVTDLQVFPSANWPEEALTIIRAAGIDSNHHHLLDGIPDIIFRDDKRYDTEGLIINTDPQSVDSRIEAELYNDANGTEIENCSDTDGGQDVGTIYDGDWLMFKSLDLSGMQSVDVRFASNESGGTIEIRLGSATGTLISSMDMPNTGGWQTWETVSASIDAVEGVHDVYLVFKTSGRFVGNINWLQFISPTPVLPGIVYAASGSSTTPTVSSNDLAQTQVLSTSATGGNEVATQHAELCNGSAGNDDGDHSDAGEVTMDSGNTFTVTLDTSVNTLGYDLTGIDSYFGWSTGSGGRANQGYEITVTYVNGSIAILAEANHWAPNSPASYWTTVSFSEASGGVMATGVKSIIFDLTEDANPGGVVVGREIDIFGVPTQDPTAHIPVFESELTVSNGNFVIGFSGTTGYRYRVESIDSLLSTNSWQVVTDIVSLATSPIDVPAPLTNNASFYRVIWIP